MKSESTVTRTLSAAGAAVRARELARHPWHARLRGPGDRPRHARPRRSRPRAGSLALAAAARMAPAFGQAPAAAS